MTTVKTLKLTHQEIELLDTLTRYLNAESESQCIRIALLDLAERSSVPTRLIDQVRAARPCCPPRRSAKLARLIGPRKRGAAKRQQAI